MKLLLITLLGLSSFSLQAYPQNNISKNDLHLAVKSVLIDYRNKIIKADTKEKYETQIQKIFLSLRDKSDLLPEEWILFEQKVESLSDFEMRDLLIAHYTKTIEQNSTNLWLLTYCLWSDDECFVHGGWVLWIFLGPLFLNDQNNSSDI